MNLPRSFFHSPVIDFVLVGEFPSRGLWKYYWCRVMSVIEFKMISYRIYFFTDCPISKYCDQWACHHFTFECVDNKLLLILLLLIHPLIRKAIFMPSCFFSSCPLYFFPFSLLLLVFFLCFFVLFPSCCSHMLVLLTTLVHVCHIFYCHSACIMLSLLCDETEKFVKWCAASPVLPM